MEVQAAAQMGGWERRRKNKPGGTRPYCVADSCARCDVAAEAPERFTQRALNNVDTRHYAIAFGNAAAAPAIHAYGVYFIKVGYGVVFLARSHIASMGAMSASME